MGAYDVTTSGARFNFNGSNNNLNNVIKVDTTHFFIMWKSTSSITAQTLTLNTTTWAISTTDTGINLGAMNVQENPKSIMVDTNHVLTIRSLIEAGNAQIITINTTTWAVTTAAAALEFGTATCSNYAIAKVDTNHFLITFAKAGCNAQMITVNTTTWACTTSSARLNFDTNEGEYSDIAQIDTNHFLVFWQGSAGKDGFAQVLTVNTTTFAVTTAAASLEFDTQDCAWNACYPVDSTHFINFWWGPAGDGFVQIFAVNTTTWAVTTAAASFEFDASDDSYNSCFQYDTTHFVNAWKGDSDGLQGLIQVFQVEIPPPTNIKNINGVAYAVIKDFNGIPMAQVDG